MDTIPNTTASSSGIHHQIQPHGVLIILDRSFQVVQYSENLSHLLEIPIHQILVTPIANFLSTDDPKENILSWLNHADHQHKRLNWRAKQKKLPIWAHIQQTPDYILLDIEPIPSDTSVSDNFLDLSQYVVDSAKISIHSLNLEQILQSTCEEVRKITGYDQVLIYQLGQKNQPNVIVGEAAKKGMPSYLGLHFPSHTISEKMRERDMTLPLQYIPHLHAPAVKMTPEINPLSKQPIDLTNHPLGMITKEDHHYLNTMDAAAATSIAILHDNVLWGIMICLHKTPKYLSVNTRLILRLIANTLANQIIALERLKDSEDERRIAKLETALTQKIAQADSLMYALDLCHHDIMELLFATGTSVYFQGNLFNYGKTPTSAEVMRLIEWLKAKKLSSYTTTSLPADFPESLAYKDKACGLLMLSITAIENNYILFYRPEFIHSILWAGKPSEGTGQSPKRTIQTVTQHALAWTEHDKKSSQFIQALIVNKQLNDLLKIKSTHDPLTGLLNHLYLEEQLKIEILRASRESLPITLMHIQIDSFRKITETFGQQAGDLVLSVFAKLLKSYFREYDYIYRNGGEEFSMLLPGVNKITALERAKLLQANIASLTVQFKEKTLPAMTISTGIAVYPNNGADVTTLIAAANAAFQQAKENGVNQTVFASQITPLIHHPVRE